MKSVEIDLPAEALKIGATKFTSAHGAVVYQFLSGRCYLAGDLSPAILECESRGLAEAQGKYPAGITRTYDQSQLDQPLLGKLRAAMGRIRETACELEAQRRCGNAELNLDEIVRLGQVLEGDLEYLKSLTRDVAAGG